jgi:hypothetical protein
MIWEDLVPDTVARKQRYWEAQQIVRRMYSLGIKKAEIARRRNLSAVRIAQIIEWDTYRGKSPVEQWCSLHFNIVEIADCLKKEKKRRFLWNYNGSENQRNSETTAKAAQHLVAAQNGTQ